MFETRATEEMQQHSLNGMYLGALIAASDAPAIDVGRQDHLQQGRIAFEPLILTQDCHDCAEISEKVPVSQKYSKYSFSRACAVKVRKWNLCKQAQ